MLFRKMRRYAVLIFGSGKVSPVCHCDARAGPDGFYTDDVIGIDISILRRSFDEYEFGQGLPSRLNRIRRRDFSAQWTDWGATCNRMRNFGD